MGAGEEAGSGGEVTKDHKRWVGWEAVPLALCLEATGVPWVPCCCSRFLPVLGGKKVWAEAKMADHPISLSDCF